MSQVDRRELKEHADLLHEAEKLSKTGGLQGQVDLVHGADVGSVLARLQPAHRCVATLEKKEQTQSVAGAVALGGLVSRFPAKKLWLDYDEEADVLYVTLKRPQKATETVELEDEGVLLRYRNDELVGITVLDASRQK
jgi:uncharacterized protein YuzE